MKKFIFIIGCFMMAVISMNAQSLEQKKICALKWTLQQNFYNKPEGSQIARLNVTEFNSLGEFQKNKVVSNAIKKVSNPPEQKRIKNILAATTDTDLLSFVPAGGRNEYKADVEKMKAQAPAQENESEEEENTEESSQNEEATPAPAPAPDITTVEENIEEQADGEAEITEETASTDTPSEGMSFLYVLLTSLGLYIILTGCLLLFLRSRKNTQKNEEMVTMEQYRSERLRLMERIKTVEIELENIKSVKVAPKIETPVVEHKPTPKPQPTMTVKPEVKPEQKVEPQSKTLFTDPNYIIHEEEAPASPRPKFSAVMFYPVPVDGVFINGSSEIEPGKSLYMLKTSDDKNATFQILNTPEAIETALISMNEMVKPACKILNSIASPVEILAEKLGTAEREGDGWRITNKAIVRLI